MFYLLCKKVIPKSDNANLKIFVIGSIFYLILHALLYYSGTTYPFLLKYRHYIYYLMLIDAAITGISYIMANRKETQINESKNDTEVNDSEMKATMEQCAQDIKILENAVATRLENKLVESQKPSEPNIEKQNNEKQQEKQENEIQENERQENIDSDTEIPFIKRE